MTEHREVILEAYDPAWADLAAEWCERIAAVAGDAVLETHHIGSTAVPGLLSKPIIDLMLGLTSFEAGATIVDPMAALGFEARGEFGIPRRHYFNREDVHVHAFAVGEGQWYDHLDFRDHLREHEHARTAYAALKRGLQARFRFDREAYTSQKSAFIVQVLRDARSR